MTPVTLTAPTSIAQMQRLLANLDNQRQRERQAYADGYRDGHRTGREAGHGHAHEEMAAAWARVAERVRATGRSLTDEELVRRRGGPGGSAYEARLARHGHEYKGGPVDFWTGRPLRRNA